MAKIPPPLPEVGVTGVVSWEVVRVEGVPKGVTPSPLRSDTLWVRGQGESRHPLGVCGGGGSSHQEWEWGGRTTPPPQ